MSRKVRRIAGIKQPLSSWRQAADALLDGQAPIPDKVEVLKELVANSPEWRNKAKAFFRQRALDVTGSKMRQKGIIPAPAEPAKTAEPETAAPTAPAPTETINQQVWREVRRLELVENGRSSITEEWIQANPHASIEDDGVIGAGL